ncbi:PadR family transcriptional regulator [Alkalibacterium sp. 20]|uniref:PadR family transcriptional regulator n=1 Tax=Alkalibacterium sp. 20 TaxID=1798803 RepID=UPI0009000269|nr:PadR family transcriptional regulator [Alkalibacterium sp. 20]OJF92044.1 PadR family transcriptional regulator [Alkalibacterium sp. 20]
MISSDVIRGYNDTFLLSLLNQGDSYGYELSRQIKEKTDGDYIIKETTMYSAFTRLSKKGYIISYPGTVTQGKKRTYYSITLEGKMHLKEKQEEWHITREVVDHLVKGEDK